ncbi:MAG: ATP-dependent Clp protease adaptor ClpS [Sediminibacterium sp.]|nr:ATP-dependent Clp protease adaptor ClpS [Sediminibacterium sp.]
MPTKENEHLKEELQLLAEIGIDSSLIVWNDDFNTFDWVIESLIKVCKHTTIQAQQCTFLIHFTGKAVVKNGNIEILETMRLQLIERNLTATIE